MATRIMSKALATAALGIGLIAVAQPVSAQISTIFDPIGDALYHAPAFQDFVFGRMTKSANGDFHLLMELAGPVPVIPPMPPPAQTEIWWLWAFDLDPTASPRGYPSAPGGTADPEFWVCVCWDGTGFVGLAYDRRPLLIGGETIVTPVTFSINGTIVEAFVPFAVIGDVPASFPWRLRTIDYAGPLGSAGWFAVDLAGSIFEP